MHGRIKGTCSSVFIAQNRFRAHKCYSHIGLLLGTENMVYQSQEGRFVGSISKCSLGCAMHTRLLASTAHPYETIGALA
jgi:hypothetical protein